MAFGEGLQNVWDKIKREVPRLPGKVTSTAINNIKDGQQLAKEIMKMATEQVVMAPFSGGITNPATMLTGYVPEAEAMIRPGGNAALNMFKNLSYDYPSRLHKSLVQRGFHTNPSIGISDRNPFAFNISPTLIYNPTSHLFDPAYAKANQLYNRDSFSFVSKNLDVSKPFRTGGADVRGTESGQESNLLLDASPRFSSFKHYERSPAGAATLARKTGKSYEHVYTDVDEMLKVMNMPGIYTVSDPATLAWIKDKAKYGQDTYEGRQAQYILNMLRTADSSYGELKVLGTVPINSDTVSAFLIPEGMYGEVLLNKIKQIMEPTGIRTGTPADLLPQQHKSMYVDLAEVLVDKAKTKDLSYTDSPSIVKDYLTEDNFYSLAETHRADNPVTKATRMIKSSPKFAADVASILTAQDSDELLNLLWKDR